MRLAKVGSGAGSSGAAPKRPALDDAGADPKEVKRLKAALENQKKQYQANLARVSNRHAALPPPPQLQLGNKKGGKGGGKGAERTPEGKLICYQFANGACKRKKCRYEHVCRTCFSPDHASCQ